MKQRTRAWTGALALAGALAAAVSAAAPDVRGRFRGPSGYGFVIEGWLLPGRARINTAWPVRAATPR